MYEWQEQFKLKEIKEKDLEIFESCIFEDPDKLDRPLSQTKHGYMLRWAIKAGWIEAPECSVGVTEGKEAVYLYNGQNIEEMHGGAVRWLGQQIDKAYTEATKIPKAL